MFDLIEMKEEGEFVMKLFRVGILDQVSDQVSG